MIIAMFAAIITSVIVPPDEQYLKYIDIQTICCLFGTLAAVCAFKNINFFYIVSQHVISIFKTTRMTILAIVYITFIGSMILANDMALLTFLPLGYFVLSSTSKEKYMAFTFIMQNIAANLGGCLTPFGNPQNLYLYSKFNIPNSEFMSIMFLTFILSVTLITVCCLCVPKEKIEIKDAIPSIDKPKAIIYAILFTIAILIVFNIIPAFIGVVIIALTLLIVDRKALLIVDYPLLLTFIFFFVFSGNLARIDIVNTLLSKLVNTNTLIVSALSCQFISNVPSAILLSQFTTNYQSLLIGVNIGGTGTLIASLASLITFREYTKHYPEKTKSYIKLFSIFNFSFLAILLVLNILI